ncbi:MAG: hypothetical protein LN412_06000 [Candidatus Thermoplasmatota archaeon]|nr:hypothetical protein [Candidatus Thermoplasmatota archaeon]
MKRTRPMAASLYPSLGPVAPLRGGQDIEVSPLEVSTPGRLKSPYDQIPYTGFDYLCGWKQH